MSTGTTNSSPVIKQKVAELYNAALIGVKSDLAGQHMTLLDWLKVLVNTLDGANPLVAQAMNSNTFNDLVTELETLVEKNIVPNLSTAGSSVIGKAKAFVEAHILNAGLVAFVEPILLGHKTKILAKPAVQPTMTESKLPPPSDKPAVTTEQKT